MRAQFNHSTIKKGSMVEHVVWSLAFHFLACSPQNLKANQVYIWQPCRQRKNLFNKKANLDF